MDSTAMVVAAGRAGALGILDGTGLSDLPVAIDRVKRFGNDLPFGIRVSPEQLQGSSIVAKAAGLVVVVCAGPWTRESLEIARRETGRAECWLIAEANSSTEIELALSVGIDGLIVVGNEAAGRVGSDSAFVLLQSALARTDRPVWVRGGIGPRVAAACMAVGAAGVVLESSLLCTRESPISGDIRERLAAWDGSETTLVESPDGSAIRIYAPPGSQVPGKLRAAAKEGVASWSRAVSVLVGWGSGQAWPIGQDASLASDLAKRHVTVGGVVQAVESAVKLGLKGAWNSRPLAANSALAKAHGTRFPILQGPMTRVSDVPPFAAAVAEEGGLPFLALALLRGAEVRQLLEKTAREVGDRPWGVGMLGFAPAELRAEQLAEVRSARPRFALIAGGRPDQAAELEKDGIATYLHVPSPGLLDQFIRSGARRFVLEGRECGGHVGPRSSFILWEQACQVLEKEIAGGVQADSLSVVFAGGIHDARSAAAVAALAGDLAARGMKIGVLMGTAYLFTAEAVESGAILKRFQDEAIRCRDTVLLETGPGHLVRVSPTPFANRFEAERRSLIEQGQSHEQIREALERLNAGRLRVAAKGVDRSRRENSQLVEVSDTDQAENGLYMLGQIACLRDGVISMAELHHEVSIGATAWIQRAGKGNEVSSAPTPEPPGIAIVGMSAILPGASDVSTFWRNSLQGIDAIEEIPPDRWDWKLYYDPDKQAPDKIYSKWGGFVPDVPFDPLRYGMPPSSLPSIEPAQLLALEATRAALADAGYAQRPFNRERTAVVLGMGGGAAQVAMGYAFRSYLPMLDTVSHNAGQETLKQCEGLLPEWTEDSFPGFLLNVTSGRIANRFDFGGANYTVDAACGSSLAALNLAVRELRTNAADMVVLGGVDTVQNPFTYLAFSKTQAFSPNGRCRPFDAGADGIVISEGVAAVVLKRLSDAERDGDRIYAVVRGVGSSSDGRSRGLTAPGIEGQMRALGRAYADAHVDPATVGYVEAHGTGTAVGDVVELDALTRLFREAGASPSSCAVGSVKSQIGHTKCAAGLAGLIHASLALHHKVLPPTIGIKRPNPRLDLKEGPFRLNTETQPWLHGDASRPRRAGVSAFGFGGTNFHAVLEAYEKNTSGDSEPALTEWPSELFVWKAENRTKLLDQLENLTTQLTGGSRPRLSALAHAIALEIKVEQGPTLAIVSSSHQDLIEKLASARNAIQGDRADFQDPSGIYFEATPQFAGSPIAFIFPGQGSQSVGMLKDLTIAFDEIRETTEVFDAILRQLGRDPVGPRIFPPPSFDDATIAQHRDRLQATDVAQPAIGASSVGVLRLLRMLGLEPDMVAGHSYGELVALHAAGSLDMPALVELSAGRGRLMREAGGEHPGAMAALQAGPQKVAELLQGQTGVLAVNFNGPSQTVVAGRSQAVSKIVEKAQANGIQARLLPVAGAFHTPIMATASVALSELAGRTIAASPSIPVYSNLDAIPHPADRSDIAARIGRHLTNPVRFTEMISNMYEGGSARIFVEVGPGGVLTPRISEILNGLPHLAVACDSKGRPGIVGLLHAIARLVSSGITLRIEALTARRVHRRLNVHALPLGDGSEPLTPSTWLVNGSRSRPVGGPEPRRLGQASDMPTASFSKPRVHQVQRLSGIMNESSPEIPHTNGKASNGATNGFHSSGHNGEHREGYHDQPSPTPPMSSHAVPSGSERVLVAFQETMKNFLDVQRETMLAYLGRPITPAAAPTRPRPVQTRPQSPSPVRPTTPPAAVRANGASPKRLPDSGPRPAQPSPRPRAATHPGPKQTSVVTNVADPVPSAAVVDRQAIADRLLQIVRDRTGYPAEVLRLDLDVEADLGIDSIKRVEILGKLRDAFPQLGGFSDSESMDRLARAATLGAIVERVEKMIGGEAKVEAKASAPRPVASPSGNGHANGRQGLDSARSNGQSHSTSAIRRLTLKLVDTPLGDDGLGGLASDGVVLITEDDRGIADLVAARLNDEGIRTVRLGADLDWDSSKAIESVVGEVREQGSIVGLIHLMPLASSSVGRAEDESWTEQVGREARILFLLAREIADDLEDAAGRGGACLVAATGMGGAFASVGQTNGQFNPGQGAVAGLVKTLAREWDDIRCRVVDLDLSESSPRLAERLASEALTDDYWSEVGYLNCRRIRLQSQASPLVHGRKRIEIKPGDPILITGGARGITSLVAAEMARRWQPTLLLVGTSAPPAAAETELNSIDSPSQIKSLLFERLSRSGRAPSPADLERAYQSFVRGREAQQTLDNLRAAGAKVEYAQADVRDAASMEKVIGDWRKRYGAPVGLIHGAGLIKDKLIRDKSPESFDQVIGTKIDGAINLMRLIDPERLKFTALFSSIAGRFGNKGQSDYSAANEVLNKLAIWLDGRWPGRVASMIWGPWSGVGMVSDLEAHLGSQGLGMIAPEVGVPALLDELVYGEKGQVEVIVSGDLGTLEHPLGRVSERLEAAR